MLAELCEDNKTLAAAPARGARRVRRAPRLATASLIEVWIDEAERRTGSCSNPRGEMTGGH